MDRSQVLLLLFFDDYQGGAELHTLDLASMLLKKAHAVKLLILPKVFKRLEDFAKSHGHESLLEHVRVEPFFTDSSSPVNPDVLRKFRDWTWVIPKGGYRSGSLSVEWLAKKWGTPLAVIEHQTPPILRASRKWFSRFGIWQLAYKRDQWQRSRCPSKILTVSRTAAKIFTDEYWYSKRKVVAIPNGVDTKRFQPDQRYRSQFRAKWQISENVTLLGMVCRLSHVKGVDVAFHALSRYVSHNTSHNCKLVIVGDGEMRSELVSLAQSLSIDQHVIWTGPTTEPCKVFPAIDFFLLPSRQEGLPLALLEAMASGCIAVASPVGGVSGCH